MSHSSWSTCHLLAQLLATCVSLRKRVHEHVTQITLVMDCQDVRVLTTGIWPHLTHLKLKFSKTLGVQSVSQLAKATHLQLQSLNVSYSQMQSGIAGVLLAVPQVSTLGRQPSDYGNDVPS